MCIYIYIYIYIYMTLQHLPGLPRLIRHARRGLELAGGIHACGHPPSLVRHMCMCAER